MDNTVSSGMGSPISTQLFILLSDWAVTSVSSFNICLISFSPSSVSGSQSSSVKDVSPEILSAIILIVLEFRSLQIVDVDSLFLTLKIFFPKIVLINVDFPELVSPEM